jgi:hypothetical protein
MNSLYKIFTVHLILIILFASGGKADNLYKNYRTPIVFEQIRFDPNNIDTWIWNTGVFDQNAQLSNAPGFQWPKGSGKFAVFTAGLTIGAFVNGTVRLAAASYCGEYAPGYVTDSSGFPVGRTDARFKFYSVRRTDNWINNPDWMNWGLMVPFGAPYVDVNKSGYYEPVVDTPGIRGAVQTIFICLTDGFPEVHQIGEGFAGGTLPLYAEAHLTAWGYDNPGYQDIQFFRWEVINKNSNSWDSAYFAIVSDADLGGADDDYIGCDTLRNLSYCYNADNDDSGNNYGYGINPPAVGFLILKGAFEKHSVPPVSHKMTSSIAFHTHIGECEYDPGSSYQSYNYLKGLKRDGTPWVIANTNPPQITKFIFSGDPETNQGWTEFGGWVANCEGSLYGPQYIPSPAGDRKQVVSSGARNLIVNPGDTQMIVTAQLIARGNNHLNSVTLLKQLADIAIQLYNNGFVIGVEPVSTEIPAQFVLYQNYPNPFNPVTKIKFSLPNPSKGGAYNVRLVVYDILGREVATLIPPLRGGEEGLKPGTYETEWDAGKLSERSIFL